MKEIQRNITDLATGQQAVTSIPAQLNYVQRNRIGTKITNLTGNDIFYGSTPGVTSASGDLLPGGRGNWIFVPCCSVIWVVCASGLTGSVSWADAYE